MTRLTAILAAVAVVAGLSVGGWFALRQSDQDPFGPCRTSAVAGGAASIGGPFALTGGEGQRVTDAEAITGPTLVYFGYSFCPDVCPMDLSRNALAADELAERGIELGQVFITIDPERDTPEVTRDFAAAIDPGLVGLTGTPEEIAAAAAAYKVYYRKNGDDPDYYLMDHSTYTYLMAPGAGFLDFFRSEATPEQVAEFGAMLCVQALTPEAGDPAAPRPLSPEDLGPDRSLLILDDDEPFLRRLTRAMEKRGFEVTPVASVAAARAAADLQPPAYAVVDLRLEDGNGLEVVAALRERRPDARIVVLTGYGAIASAVAAVKIGATDYLAKPADANDVTSALLARGSDRPEPPEHPMTADRIRWEHIQRIYELCDHNVSETARRLNMHRRTLQRILAKRSPK